MRRGTGARAMTTNDPVEARVEDLLGRLTFEEKCMLCAGEGNNCPPAIPRLGIPPFGMTDGPHGVSPYRSGVGPSGAVIPEGSDGAATYFPTGIQLASTWNPAMLEAFGAALGEETRAVGRFMQLGPAMNICRSPMNGRTFEYFSEDPVLSGALGAAVVRGLQSRKIAPCVKHYVANNFETNRFKVNAVISPRALHEIYLEGFRRCVEGADPWGVMSAYNKINGTYVSEHVEILRTILKDTWGFSGVVVSDWGATKHVSGIKGLIEAGLDIEMGSRFMYNMEEMKRMKEAGEFPSDLFDDGIRRFLRTMIRTGALDEPASRPAGAINTPEHQALARQLAEQGTVLLKNDGNILPLDAMSIKRIAVVGKHATTRFGRKKLGGGSSAVYPPYEVTIREGLAARCGAGIEIVDDPASADVAICCIGLEHSHDFKGGDHEGSDRLRYGAGFMQDRLVRRTVKQNPNTIVICVNGAPFGLEAFINKVPAVLEAWYGGMEIGNAVAAILFGDVNPSGKLPVSWPKRKRDIPTAFTLVQTLLGVKEVRYDEGVMIGYRHFDARGTEPRFCFGHGLSYTTFAYSDLRLDKSTMTRDGTVTATCTVTNTGTRDGDEIVQCYIRDVEASVERPPKELKAFARVQVPAGKAATVSFTLTSRDLSFYDETTGAWTAEPGAFEVLLGASSRDIRLAAGFTLP